MRETALPFRSDQPLRIVAECFGQNFDRDVSPENGVVSAIHVAHASRAQHRIDPVRSEHAAREHRNLVGDESRSDRERRLLEKRATGRVLDKKRLDLGPQCGVLAARAREKLRPIRTAEWRSLVIELLDA